MVNRQADIFDGFFFVFKSLLVHNHVTKNTLPLTINGMTDLTDLELHMS